MSDIPKKVEVARQKGTSFFVYRCPNGAQFLDLQKAIDYTVAQNLRVADITRKDNTYEIVLSVIHYPEHKGYWANMDGLEDGLEAYVEPRAAYDDYIVDLYQGGFLVCRDFRLHREDGSFLEGKKLFDLGADKVFDLYYETLGEE